MFEYLAVYTRPYFTGRSQHLHNGQSFDDLCTGHPDDTLKERPSLAARTAGSSFAALEADCAFRGRNRRLIADRQYKLLTKVESSTLPRIRFLVAVRKKSEGMRQVLEPLRVVILHLQPGWSRPSMGSSLTFT